MRYGGGMTNLQQERWKLLGLAVSFEGGLAVLAFLLGWLLEQPPLAEIQFNSRGLVLGLAASLPMLLLFVICVRWPVGPLRQIKAFSEEVIRPWFQPCSWVELALIALVAGVGEEMLFRGVLQNWLARRIAVWEAVVLTNGLFGLLHLITPTYAVLAGMMGVYLSGVWLCSGNLLVVIVAHGFYDFVALVFVVRRSL
jgi:membrane protease YdiL (CAAX protease family)